MLCWVPRGVLQNYLLAAELPAACGCILKREFPPLIFKHTQTVCSLLATDSCRLNSLVSQELTRAHRAVFCIEMVMKA